MIGMHIIFLRTDSLNKALCQSATSVFFNANLFWRFVNIYIYMFKLATKDVFFYICTLLLNILEDKIPKLFCVRERKTEMRRLYCRLQKIS